MKVRTKIKTLRRMKLEKKMRKENLIEEAPVETDVPPYPERKENLGTKQFGETAAPESTPEADVPLAVDTKQLSFDLVDMAGKIWHTINPRVREFERSEINNIAAPMAAVIEKYDLTKYMKYFGYTQEMLLIYNTFNVVAPRIKELKNPPTHLVDGTPDDI